MNRCALVLVACLVWPTAPALAQKRLEILVRFEDAVHASNSRVEAGVRIGEGGSRAGVSAQASRVEADERIDQRVQTVDGGRATILTGTSRPTRQRQYIQTPGGVVSQEVTVVQEQTAGFEVVPRLTGSDVRVEIAHQAGSQIARGRLGEWFELGAIASPQGTRRVQIRVDEIR